MEKLTLKEEKFVSNLIKGMTQESAFLDAGYNSKYPQSDACKLASKPKIKKAIEKKRERITKRLELEEDFELIHGKKILELSEKHIETEDGGFNSGAALSAIQANNLIAKLRGKFVTKVQIGLADGFSSALEGLSMDVIEGTASEVQAITDESGKGGEL